MSKVYLKIKCKSLAAEAQIIRAEERKFPGEHPIRYGLHEHRVLDVRRAARSSYIAYGFLKGMPYMQIESKAKKPPNWGEILTMIKKYGTTKDQEKFEGWKTN